MSEDSLADLGIWFCGECGCSQHGGPGGFSDGEPVCDDCCHSWHCPTWPHCWCDEDDQEAVKS